MEWTELFSVTINCVSQGPEAVMPLQLVEGKLQAAVFAALLHAVRALLFVLGQFTHRRFNIAVFMRASSHLQHQKKWSARSLSTFVTPFTCKFRSSQAFSYLSPWIHNPHKPKQVYCKQNPYPIFTGCDNNNNKFYTVPQQQLYELLVLYRPTNAIKRTSICYLN